MDSRTPKTDAIRNTPVMGETVTEHKWDKMTEHARSLELSLAAANERLRHVEKYIVALNTVENAELFQDGISADLYDHGIDKPSVAYMQGRLDACEEIRSMVIDAALAGAK